MLLKKSRRNIFSLCSFCVLLNFHRSSRSIENLLQYLKIPGILEKLYFFLLFFLNIFVESGNENENRTKIFFPLFIAMF